MGDDKKTKIDWDTYGGGGAVGGSGGDIEGAMGTPSYPKDRVVRSLAHLQALIPDYENRSLADLLKSPLFTGKTAYTIDPKFYGDLQGLMQVIEAKSGVSVSDFANKVPAGVLGSQSRLNDVLNNLGIGGSGSGSGSDHYATDVQAMLQKMAALKDFWQQQIENVNSGVTLEAGRAGFEADWAKLMNEFNTSQAQMQQNVDLATAQLQDTAKGREIEDVRNREVEEALRRTRVAEDATRRANIITGDVLPRFVTGNNPINVPFLGPTRGTNVNFAELFNQGGAGNLNTLPAIAPQFAGGYGATPVAAPPQLPPIGPMPTYPTAPQYPAVPDALRGWLGI